MKETFHQQQLLTSGECDELISLWGLDQGHGGEYHESEEYISKRTSIIEYPPTIYEKLRDAVDRANRDNWGYEGELCRSGELYRYEPGDFFDWHMDLGDGRISKRKLSTLIQLSRPSEYEGGRLEIFGNDEHTASTRRGMLMIYPSYIMHRVTEVTHGLRFSVGGEVLGEPFR
ncbi:MAG: 2OG-Fe(II) oxygenase [Myxococcota bacterium]